MADKKFFADIVGDKVSKLRNWLIGGTPTQNSEIGYESAGADGDRILHMTSTGMEKLAHLTDIEGFKDLPQGNPADWDVDVLGRKVYTIAGSNASLFQINNQTAGDRFIWNFIASGGNRTVTFGGLFTDLDGNTATSYTIPAGRAETFEIVSTGGSGGIITSHPKSGELNSDQFVATQGQTVFTLSAIPKDAGSVRMLVENHETHINQGFTVAGSSVVVTGDLPVIEAGERVSIYYV